MSTTATLRRSQQPPYSTPRRTTYLPPPDDDDDEKENDKEEEEEEEEKEEKMWSDEEEGEEPASETRTSVSRTECRRGDSKCSKTTQKYTNTSRKVSRSEAKRETQKTARIDNNDDGGGGGDDYTEEEEVGVEKEKTRRIKPRSRVSIGEEEDSKSVKVVDEMVDENLTQGDARRLIRKIERKYPSLGKRSSAPSSFLQTQSQDDQQQQTPSSLRISAVPDSNGVYKIGDRLGDYRIVHPFADTKSSSSSRSKNKHSYIGRGSFGTVYRVEKIHSPESEGSSSSSSSASTCRLSDVDVRTPYYALKVIHTNLLHHELSAKMVVEATVMQYLRHPQLMSSKTILLSSEKGTIGIVMPLGISMDDWLRGDAASNVPACLYYVAQELRAGLEFLWSNGMAHQDLKPPNIVFIPVRNKREAVCGRHFRPVFSDFGTAKRWVPGSCRSEVLGSYTGTLAYLPPERLLPNVHLDAESRRLPSSSSSTSSSSSSSSSSSTVSGVPGIKRETVSVATTIPAPTIKRRTSTATSATTTTTTISSSGTTKTKQHKTLAEVSRQTALVEFGNEVLPHVGFDAFIRSDIWSFGSILYALFFHTESTDFRNQVADRGLLPFDAALPDATESKLETFTDSELRTRAIVYERIVSVLGRWPDSWQRFLKSRGIPKQAIQSDTAYERTTLVERMFQRTFTGLEGGKMLRQSILHKYGRLNPVRQTPSCRPLTEEALSVARFDNTNHNSLLEEDVRYGIDTEIDADSPAEQRRMYREKKRAAMKNECDEPNTTVVCEMRERRKMRLAFHELFDGIYQLEPHQRRIHLEVLADLPLMTHFLGLRVPLYRSPPPPHPPPLFSSSSSSSPLSSEDIDDLFDPIHFHSDVTEMIDDANDLYRRYAAAAGALCAPITLWFRLAVLSLAAKRYGRSGLHFMRNKIETASPSPFPFVNGSKPPLSFSPLSSLHFSSPSSRVCMSRKKKKEIDRPSESELRALTALTSGLTVEEREHVYKAEKVILETLQWKIW